MSRIFLFTLIFLTSAHAYAQLPLFSWAQSANSPFEEKAIKTRIDKHGNIYIVGSFKSATITFGSYTLVNPTNGNSEMFIVKYDPSHNVLWALKDGGFGEEDVRDMDIDSAGNVYVTGNYNSNWTSFGNDTLSNSVATDIFVVKYDASGTFQWVKNFGGDYAEVGSSIKVLNNGSFYLGGQFNSSQLEMGAITFTSPNTWGNYFIAYFDADGNAIWGNCGHAEQSHAEVSSIEVDNWGNCYIAGTYSGSYLVLGTDTILTEIGHSYIFFAKFDNVGNYIWGKTVKYSCPWNNKIRIVWNGSWIYMAGNHEYPYVMDFGNGFTLPPEASTFVAKFDTAGFVQWVTGSFTYGSCDIDCMYDFTIDDKSNLYLAGQFSGSKLVFGQDTMFNSNGGTWTDLFVVKLDSNGTTQWVKNNQYNGFSTGSQNATTIAVNDNYDIYVAGWYQNPTLVLDTLNLYNTFMAAADYYIAEIAQCFVTVPTITQLGDTLSSSTADTYQWYHNGIAIPGAIDQTYISIQPGDYHVVVKDATTGCRETSAVFPIYPLNIITYSENRLRVFPNPSQGLFNIISTSSEAEISVFNPLGQLVLQPKKIGKNSSFKISIPGIYWLQVKHKGQSDFYKLIVN